jgi:hypothetical protein
MRRAEQHHFDLRLNTEESQPMKVTKEMLDQALNAWYVAREKASLVLVFSITFGLVYA